MHIITLQATNVPRDLVYPKTSIEESLQEAVLKAAGTTKGAKYLVACFGINRFQLFFQGNVFYFKLERIGVTIAES